MLAEDDAVERWSDEEDFYENEERLLEKWSKQAKSRRGKQKVGRKQQWPTEIVNDLVDVILDNENFKTKLLMTNTKNVKNSEYYNKAILEVKERCKERNVVFSYDLKQTRDKFKRCVSSCREAALKIKTASGITRFQEEKQYGSWFNKLFAVVKSMDNCQPEQSIEPDVEIDHHGSNEELPSGGDKTPSSAESNSGVAGPRKRKFVPIHETSRKSSKHADLAKTLDSINDALANDGTKELIEFLKEDSIRQQEKDDRFMNLMERMLTPVTPPTQPQYPWNVMVSPQNMAQHQHRYDQTLNFNNDKTYESL